MIKITKHIYIHPLVPILFLISYYSGILKSFFLCYFVMALHEFAHLFAAVFIGLTPKDIRIYPFGLNLRLENKIVYSFSDELILYLSGPFLNIILALLGMPFKNHNFYVLNISLFFINILPIPSLDGGVIFSKILSKFFGTKKGERIFKVIGGINLSLLIFLFCYLLYKNNFNFSLFFLIIFVLLNLFTSDEKYDVDLLMELMFYKEKRKKNIIKKVKLLITDEGFSKKEIAKNFSLNNYYLIMILDKNERMKKIITEGEIIKSLLKE